MTTRRLRARLDRLAPSVVPQLGQDRDRDRQRRDELFHRKLVSAGITDREQAELLGLQALFLDEDRDRPRLLELELKQFPAEHSGTVPLTELRRASLQN